MAVERYNDGHYLQATGSWHAEDSPWKAAHVIAALDEEGIQFASCVDVGCGAGGVLEELAARNPVARYVGWEISSDVATLWPPNSAIDYRIGDASTDPEHYDVALVLDVFEHIEDYFGFLRGVGGLASTYVFHIPLDMNVSAVLRARHVAIREQIGHLHSFSAETALATLRDTGYEVVAARFTRGARELPSARRGLRTDAVNLIRRLLPDRAGSRLLGGYSLLVVARSVHSA